MADTAGVGIVKPVNLADQGVSEGLLRTAWSTEVQFESVVEELLFNAPTLTGQIGVGEKKMVPQNMFLNVTPNDTNGKAARKVVLTFTRALDDTGRFGNAETLLGNEETIRLKYASFYANDWAHAVSGESYGIDFRELSATQIFSIVKPLLAQWYGELNGYFAREAVCQSRDTRLTKAPVSLAQPINPNVYFPALGYTSSQPTYDSTASDWEDNVGDAATSVTAANNHLNVGEILDLSDWAVSKYLRPIKHNGLDLYVLNMCADEYTRFHKPATTDSWASYWKDAAAITDLNKVVPGASVVIGDSVVVCRDRRAPTVVFSGNSTNWVTTWGYMKPGRNDGRTTTRTDKTHCNVNMLFGTNALGKYEPERPHYEEQKDEYGKYYGVSFTGGFGWQIVYWDVDTPTDSTIQQEGSAIILTQR